CPLATVTAQAAVTTFSAGVCSGLWPAAWSCLEFTKLLEPSSVRIATSWLLVSGLLILLFDEEYFGSNGLSVFHTAKTRCSNFRMAWPMAIALCSGFLATTR